MLNQCARITKDKHYLFGAPVFTSRTLLRDRTQQAVDALQKEAKPGETVESNKQIKGHDSTRRPDAQIVDKNRRTRKITEVERKPNSKRNQQRESEYQKLGIPNETRPVTPRPNIPGPTNPQNPNPPYP